MPAEFRTITYPQWIEEGKAMFGPNSANWKFVCPVCHHVASVQDWRDAGAEEAAAFSCIGRWRENPRKAFENDGVGPCNYAGGGLFRLNPVTVTDVPDGGPDHCVFEFAKPQTQEAAA